MRFCRRSADGPAPPRTSAAAAPACGRHSPPAAHGSARRRAWRSGGAASPRCPRSWQARPCAPAPAAPTAAPAPTAATRSGPAEWARRNGPRAASIAAAGAATGGCAARARWSGLHAAATAGRAWQGGPGAGAQAGAVCGCGRGCAARWARCIRRTLHGLNLLQGQPRCAWPSALLCYCSVQAGVGAGCEWQSETRSFARSGLASSRGSRGSLQQWVLTLYPNSLPHETILRQKQRLRQSMQPLLMSSSFGSSLYSSSIYGGGN